MENGRKEPQPLLLEQLKKGSLIEKLIAINKISEINNSSIINPVMQVVQEGNLEIVEAVAGLIANKIQLFDSTIKSEINNTNNYIRWCIALAISIKNIPHYIPYVIPALGLGFSPIIRILMRYLVVYDERFNNSRIDDQLASLTAFEKEGILSNCLLKLGKNASDSLETLETLEILKYLKWERSIVPIIKVTEHPDHRIQERANDILSNNYEDKMIYKACKYVIYNREACNEKYNFLLSNDRGYPLSIYAIKGLGRNLSRLLFKKQSDILWSILNNSYLNLEKIYALRSLFLINTINYSSWQITSAIRIKLRDLLEDLDIPMKQLSLNIFSKLGFERVAEIITIFINDRRPAIRLAVINALTQSPIESKSLFEKIAILLVDENIAVREATRLLFWKMRPELYGKNEGDIIITLPKEMRTVILEKMLKGFLDYDVYYKKFASFWLSVMQYKPAFRFLMAGLDEINDELRERIIISIGLYGDKKALKFLEPYIYSTEGIIQTKIIQTISSLGFDGLSLLINNLYNPKEDYSHPEALENILHSFGGKIIRHIELEIQYCKDTLRKELLNNFYNKLVKEYSFEKEDGFTLLL